MKTANILYHITMRVIILFITLLLIYSIRNLYLVNNGLDHLNMKIAECQEQINTISNNNYTSFSVAKEQ